MGILQKYFNKTKPNSSLGGGNHAINKDDIIAGGVAGRFSPENTPEW